MLVILSWAVLSAAFLLCAFTIWVISLSPQRYLLFESLLFAGGLAIAVGWFFGFVTWPVADLLSLGWLHLAPFVLCMPLVARCLWLRWRHAGRQLCSGCGEPQVLRVMYRTTRDVCRECGCRRTFPAERALWGREDQSKRAIELVGSHRRILVSAFAILVCLAFGLYGARWCAFVIADPHDSALTSRAAWAAGVVLATTVAFVIRERGVGDPLRIGTDSTDAESSV